MLIINNQTDMKISIEIASVLLILGGKASIFSGRERVFSGDAFPGRQKRLRSRISGPEVDASRFEGS